MRERERERETGGRKMTTTAFCAADLMVERKVWRHISAWDEMPGFQAKPKTHNLFIWDCIVPGKPGTIFADGRFPVVLDFRKSSYIGLPTVYVPEEFGSNLENQKHYYQLKFHGVEICCYDRVWGAYERALRCFVPPRAPDTSIKTI